MLEYVTRQVDINTYRQDLSIKVIHRPDLVKCHHGKGNYLRRKTKPNRKSLSLECSNINENKRKSKRKRKKELNRGENWLRRKKEE